MQCLHQSVSSALAFDLMKRLPIYSLVSGGVLAVIATGVLLTGTKVPSIGLAAMGLVPLAAAFVDAIRMQGSVRSGTELAGKSFSDVAGHGDGAGQGGALSPPAEAELRAWVHERTQQLNERERELNVRSLALQQWMQFPDAIDFQSRDNISDEPKRQAVPNLETHDPLAKHDQELFELIDHKTRQLFEDIKADAYRETVHDKKVFDNAKIRGDLVQLVSDVAAIYRPDDPSPLLRTNVEALSRATGRASLRFLVAIENLPGGISSYDFQTIYTVVSRAVQTYGMYKSAKPYLDVASGLLFAGRIVSSTNPVTLVAWYAASKATTFGASKLGGHMIDQQAVGLIRQLVEIVSLEIASLYSPMIRYRDIHWTYGVELVHLASEMSLSESARLRAMSELSALQLRDEYGRVSLMRHLANGKTSHPDRYKPSQSLSMAERMAVAERLESFVISNVLSDSDTKSHLSSIERWQTAASERLEIQFRAGHVDVDLDEQNERAVWSLAAFALQHLGDEPDQAVTRMRATKCWNAASTSTHNEWIRHLKSEPPYLYHAPVIDPASSLCGDFLDDLIEIASCARPSQMMNEASASPAATQITIPPWSGRSALQVTAYFLRTDVTKYLQRYQITKTKCLFGERDPGTLVSTAPGLLDALGYLSGEHRISCAYSDATFRSSANADPIEKVYIALIQNDLVCFSVQSDQPTAPIALTIRASCHSSDAVVTKLSGYVRSDCRIEFPGGTQATVPGSSLKGYDSYFRALLGTQ